MADVSNKAIALKTTIGKEKGKGGVIVIQDKEVQKPSAISKPAQRIKSAAVAKPEAVQHAAPRRATRKTAVYEDKKRSPKKASPKVTRDAVSKRGDQQLPTVRHKAPLRPLARVKQETKEDEPVYSDQHPHLYDGGYADYEDEKSAEIEEYDDDATDVEEDEPHVDAKARFHNDVEAITDSYTLELSDEEDEDFTTAPSRAGDNTTGMTTQVLVPKWTSKARKEISQLNQQYSTLQDEDEEADISMVAEYGDEIFEYMRELEVYYAVLGLECSRANFINRRN